MARRRFEIDIHVKSLKIGQRNLQDFHFDDGKSKQSESKKVQVCILEIFKDLF